jgi:hypothetical protein
MLFEDFEGSNLQLNKPGSMTDEECGSLMAFHGRYANGVPFFRVHAKPSKEDLEALNAGRGIWLDVLGTSFPPVSLFTADEQGNVNE